MLQPQGDVAKLDVLTIDDVPRALRQELRDSDARRPRSRLEGVHARHCEVLENVVPYVSVVGVQPKFRRLPKEYTMVIVHGAS